jgi:hypothetical protein
MHLVAIIPRFLDRQLRTGALLVDNRAVVDLHKAMSRRRRRFLLALVTGPTATIILPVPLLPTPGRSGASVGRLDSELC